MQVQAHVVGRLLDRGVASASVEPPCPTIIKYIYTYKMYSPHLPAPFPLTYQCIHRRLTYGGVTLHIKL